MNDTPSSGNAESADSADNGTDKYMVPALERGLRLLQEFGRGIAARHGVPHAQHAVGHGLSAAC